MSFDDLNDDNLLIYAAKFYDKPNVLMSEFKDDMKRFNYLKRLFFKYQKYGEIRERLILNHLVVIYNVFGVEAATRILFFKITEKYYSALKTYLVFLSCMPEKIHGINGRTILSSDITIDAKIAEVLRGLK
jgi:hypothetical protein